MRIYLDLCCLKRPFDLQDQPIVRIETEAVLSLLDLPSDSVQFVRSMAHVLENSFNTNQARREAVDAWLSAAPPSSVGSSVLSQRVEVLSAQGFGSFDAMHLACAELAGAAVFLTVDRKLLRLAGRLADVLRLRVVNPVHFLEEVSPWKH